ncbi:hypothetical protein B9N43_15480 [Denitratisoma sp. DHT3]|uniref:PAS domain S-box protein n=1 Tax=Denitratisoma sp. DHT3 TaxID=1981880 RepID=UPI001198B21C|nr:PAS domain-containing protein [Denitratisoma sp. DHT3]QDX82511.1 hypothetical protein B9N43_15480 [Denitratisoma sp. DHT3]
MNTRIDTGVTLQQRNAAALLGTMAAENIETEGIECAALLLDLAGRVRDANRSAECLFGYSRAELLDWHVSLLLPKLAEVHDQEVFRRLAYLSHCGVAFRANRNHGRDFACAVFFTYIHGTDGRTIRLTIRKIENTGTLCL